MKNKAFLGITTGIIAAYLIGMNLFAATDDKLTGVWYLTELNGLNAAESGMTSTLTFEKDGTALWDITTIDLNDIGNTDSSLEGTWTETDDGVTAIIDGTEYKFTYSDNTLVHTEDPYEFKFGRELPEAEKIPEEMKADSIESFNGVWEGYLISYKGTQINPETYNYGMRVILEDGTANFFLFENNGHDSTTNVECEYKDGTLIYKNEEKGNYQIILHKDNVLEMRKISESGSGETAENSLSYYFKFNLPIEDLDRR